MNNFGEAFNDLTASEKMTSYGLPYPPAGAVTNQMTWGKTQITSALLVYPALKEVSGAGNIHRSPAAAAKDTATAEKRWNHSSSA